MRARTRLNRRGPLALTLTAIVVLALVALIAPRVTAAPVRTVSASSEAERQEKLRQRMFATQVLVTAKTNQVRDAYVSLYMMAWMVDNPDATAEQADHAMRVVTDTWNEAEYDTTGSGPAKIAAGVKAVMDVAGSGNPVVGGLKKVGSSFLQDEIGKYEKTAEWKKNAAGDRLAADLMQILGPYKRQIYESVADFAKVKPAFGEAWDRNIGARLGISSRATLAEIEQDPNIPLNVREITAIDYSNEPQAFEDAITAETTKVMKKHRAQVKVALAGLSGNKVPEHVSLTDYAPPIDFDTYGEIVESKVDWDAVLQNSYLAVSILSQLASWVDADFAKDLEIVATAAYQIGKAVSDFVPAALSMGMGVLSNVATANMVGAVLAGVQALMPLFTDSMPGGVQGEIMALRDDIAKLGEQMQARFDSIDAQLSVIYGDMLAQFDEVIRLGRITQTQLYQVNLQISALSSRLDAWGTEIFAALQEIALRDATTVLDGYVHYAAGHNGEQIPKDRYVHDVEIPLRAALTQAVTNAPFVGPAKSDGAWKESQIDDALRIYKANGAIGYLDWYARQKYGYTGPALGTVPNPAAWLALARGYEVLASENSEAHRDISPDRAAAVVAQGREILKANQSFSRPLSTPREDGTRTNKLFTGLVNGYDTAVGKLNDLLRETQKEFDNNHLFNLFGNPEQPVEKMGDPGYVRPCAPEGQELNDPVALKRPPVVTLANLPSLYVLASHHLDMANAPDVYLCQDVEYVNERIVSRGRYGFSRYADLRISFKVRMEQGSSVKDVQSWVRVYPQVHNGCEYTYGTTADRTCDMGPYAIVKTWKQYDGYPDHNGTGRWEYAAWIDGFNDCVPVGEDPNIYPQLRGQVVQFIAGRQLAYYTKVARELETVASPLNKAGQAVAKATTLLQEYSRIGWANTIEQDDLMKMALFSAQRLPSDLGDDLMITRMFQDARDVYASCLPDPSTLGDGHCTSSPTEYDPMSGQSLPATCPTDIPDAARTADPVANCLLGFALGRSKVLAERYEVASKAIAAGTYSEDMPQISHAVSRLENTDKLIHVS
ncbi:hypothetical protein ABZ815_38235 [Nonomuraea sp. NPDC047529]|uniref:hypothetical protein n=1 Tax=Nonomuraea sp. NPDC047529 TaxID=3155623 RepID=UPI003405AEB4